MIFAATALLPAGGHVGEATAQRRGPRRPVRAVRDLKHLDNVSHRGPGSRSTALLRRIGLLASASPDRTGRCASSERTLRQARFVSTTLGQASPMATAVFGSCGVKPAMTFSDPGQPAHRRSWRSGPEDVKRVSPSRGMLPTLGGQAEGGLDAERRYWSGRDGFWMDPPVSSPMPATAKSPATDAAVPVEDPARGDQSRFRMLKVGHSRRCCWRCCRSSARTR